MNYKKIGTRIRKYRKANDLSQAQLAEKLSISTTHMSHIETGSAKMSLSLLAAISKVLSVQIVELLSDGPETARTPLMNELGTLLDTCSTHQLHIILDVVKAVKASLDINNVL